MRKIITLGLIMLFVTLACIFPAVAGAAPTPTPTSVIQAVELTPTAKSPATNEDILWKGTITSDTSRQYMANGAQVNFCTTNWVTDYLLRISPNGDVTGEGQGNLFGARTCTNNNMAPNITGFNIRIQGTKGSSQFLLQFLPGTPTTGSAGEFGGYNLLFLQAICPSFHRTLQLPLTGPDTVDTTLSFSVQMTGCGGSANDIMMSKNLVKMSVYLKCKDILASPSDQEAVALCKQ
jgi:hypothetical protein